MHSFRKILRTTLLFLLIVAVGSVGLMELYFRSERDAFQDSSERKALAGSLDCLIVGASHGYRGFDPTVIDPILGTTSYNLSGALMTMRGRYELLKLEVSRNPVKTVVLEVSYNTLTRNRRQEGTEGDLYTMARLDRFTDRTRFFFGFFAAEWGDVYYKFVSEGVDVILDKLEGKYRKDSRTRYRGYLPTGMEPAYEFTDEYQSVYKSRWRWLQTEIDPWNLDYLDKIVELCEEEDIELVLVTTPLSKEFLCSYGDFDEFYDWYRAYAWEHGLRYYDFNLYREKEALLPDKTMFYDTLHLNDEGAALFSRLFAELYRRDLAGEDLSGLFYDSYKALDATWGLTWN